MKQKQIKISKEVVGHFMFTHSESEIIKKFRSNFGWVLNNPYLRFKKYKKNISYRIVEQILPKKICHLFIMKITNHSKEWEEIM